MVDQRVLILADTILPTGAGLEAIKNVKGVNLIVDDISKQNLFKRWSYQSHAQPVVRANAREFLNRIKDLTDEPGETQLYLMLWKHR